MTMQVAAYGRLGSDPRSIETSTGKTMAVGSIAVTLTDRQGDEQTQWLGIVAFGRVAETLLKHSKGELISVSGRVQANTYQERVELQVVADIVVSARSARPGGGKRKGAGNGAASDRRAAPEDDGATVQRSSARSVNRRAEKRWRLEEHGEPGHVDIAPRLLTKTHAAEAIAEGQRIQAEATNMARQWRGRAMRVRR